MKTIWTLPSPIGLLTLQLNGTDLEAIHFEEVEVKGYELKKTKQTQKVISELDEYFEGTRKVFTFPVKLEGTAFQKQVWQALRQIPYGETRSYKEIAEEIGHERAYRAVGSANRVNQFPIVIPCHRVIGANGKLSGYAGGLQIKVKLLQLEKSFLEQEAINRP